MPPDPRESHVHETETERESSPGHSAEQAIIDSRRAKATRIRERGESPFANDVRATNADFTPLDQQNASEEALDFCARNHIPVWVWTVDDPARIGQLVQAKIDGIITNRPSQTRLAVQAAVAGP